ncbi:MAG: hypothetical protein MUF31_08260 [Akkermansiaceae bacterium]|jgi:hypothetical protein|nr:hypothetical protein [Akkermansiaceae bacterium]
MKRYWPKPVLIPSVVSRDREYIEVFATIAEQDVPLALLAPEVPVHADNGRIKIQWLIGNASAEEKKLRKLINTGLDERLLEKDDPSPWTTLVYQCHDSETLYGSDEGKIGWAIEHSLPTAPQRPDWMFDDIPDEEVIACCLWEYGRESHTFGMTAADHWVKVRRWMEEAYADDPELERWHDKEQVRIEEWLNEVGYTFDEFSDRFWQGDFPLIEIYDTLRKSGGTSAAAWQELHIDERERLVRKVGESCVLRPLVAASVGDLEKLWNANNLELLEIRSRKLPANDDTEDGALYSESTHTEILWEPDKPAEYIAAAFTVDFSRFTDREILDAFRDWLKQARPAQWERPRRVFPNAPQRGRKLIDYRVALERLGLMRLLNDNYPDHLRKNYPEVWKRLSRDETHFRRECKLACDFFRTLFPFLPEDELPRSSKPVEIWEPEIEAELAQQKADGSPPTGE